MIWLASSIMGILIPNIADKDLLLVVPTLKIASGQFQQVLRRRIGKHGDIFFGDVTDRFVVGAAKINISKDEVARAQ